MLKDVSIIVPVAPGETAHERLLHGLSQINADVIVSSEGSRAASLNAGAKKAQRAHLWFLHADTLLRRRNIKALEESLPQNPNMLHYFKLEYEEPGLVSMNAIGANIRSRLLGLPYGDQGFCISKAQFDKIGGFPEATYGEDLLFVRRAKHAGVKLHCLPCTLKTSARKYKDVGWLKLTAIRQVQMLKLLGQKI